MVVVYELATTPVAGKLSLKHVTHMFVLFFVLTIRMPIGPAGVVIQLAEQVLKLETTPVPVLQNREDVQGQIHVPVIGEIGVTVAQAVEMAPNIELMIAAILKPKVARAILAVQSVPQHGAHGPIVVLPVMALKLEGIFVTE